jgi:hypothetical protein
MLAWEREIGELPSPICPRLTERSGGDLLFFGLKKKILARPPLWDKIPFAKSINRN